MHQPPHTFRLVRFCSVQHTQRQALLGHTTDSALAGGACACAGACTGTRVGCLGRGRHWLFRGLTSCIISAHLFRGRTACGRGRFSSCGSWRICLLGRGEQLPQHQCQHSDRYNLHQGRSRSQHANDAAHCNPWWALRATIAKERNWHTVAVHADRPSFPDDTCVL